MANRNVFKFLSSVGPGGCIATFCEKICSNVFDEGYNQADPAMNPSEEFQRQAKETRQKFVQGLFEDKGNYVRDLECLDQAVQDAAYEKLARHVADFKAKVVKAEQSRLARERLFYKPNSLQYKRLVEAAKRVDEDTTDNLIKMALHIVKEANKDKLMVEFAKIAGGAVSADIEEQNIEERISRARAQELLHEWKQILMQYHSEGNNTEALFGGDGAGDGLLNNQSSPELESLKDQLFVATGEDQLDTWEAFKHYNLNPQLTSADLQNAI